jgi:hypothetical protein
MTTMAQTLRGERKVGVWIGVGFGAALLLAAIGMPNLNRSRIEADKFVARQRVATELAPAPLSPYAAGAAAERFVGSQETVVPAGKAIPKQFPDAALGRRIVRTSSIEMVVAHPAEMVDRIAALAEGLGGYLESSDGSEQNGATQTMTVRVPAAQFEQARAEIRKLGLRVENEKIAAQDVTQQYVDQDASVRNLRAEEAQYLMILKQARSVKDMLAVSEQLSDVRGQIEREQAEFNALSQQVETVAIAISLRAEEKEQVFGLNWRPGYQLKLALHDGLESLATYATSVTTILFYLPAAILWVGTIGAAGLALWRLVRWARRLLGWTDTAAAAQG